MIFDIIIPLVAGFGGTLLGIRHTELSRKKEYKSVLLLLIQEFILLLERSTMHYYQFVKGPVHSSALFQISDNNTFLKLAQVCDNTECIKVALELKADFFQVERHVQRASEYMSKYIDEHVKGHAPLASEEFKKANYALSMAINFFVGDQIIDGNFYRNRFDRYIDKIFFLNEELRRINAKSAFSMFQFRRQVFVKFVESQTSKLEHIREKIKLIREKEEVLYNRALKNRQKH